MQVSFSGKTADEVWQQAANVLRSDYAHVNEGSRGGITHEILQATFRIEDPRQRWVSTRQPAMNPAFALAEVVWIMAGRNDSAPINFWNPKYPDFAGTGETYHGAYGHRLRRQSGIDQLERAYLALKTKSSSRQVVLQIWDATTDMPQENGKPTACDVPCNIVSMLKVRDRKLHWTQVIRSNDLMLGVPHNFVQFMTLQEIMSGWLGVEPGPYVQWSDSLHVYERDLDDLHRQAMPPSPPSTDDFAIPKSESDAALAHLSESLDILRQPNMTLSEVHQIAQMSNLPSAYQNALCVIAADAARRTLGLKAADEIASKCSSPVLSSLWERWRDRKLEEEMIQR